MTISAPIDPLDRPQYGLQFVDENGRLTDVGIQFLSQMRDFVSGCGRLIPCNASGTNIITLTPSATAPPINGYFEFDVYVFAAAETSTGAVTMTVVPQTGTLATIKGYKTSGAAQAGAGDVVQNSVYMAIYAGHLDAAAGGFVLK